MVKLSTPAGDFEAAGKMQDDDDDDDDDASPV